MKNLHWVGVISNSGGFYKKTKKNLNDDLASVGARPSALTSYTAIKSAEWKRFENIHSGENPRKKQMMR